MLNFLNKKKGNTIGLDIGATYIKAVQLKDAPDGYELAFFDMVPVPPGLIAEGVISDKAAIIGCVKELMKKAGVRSGDAVIGVSGHSSVIIKRITIPMMGEEELNTSMRYEAEQYIPFDINEVNIDFQILGPKPDEEGQMEVLLVAVKKNVVNDLVEIAESAGLDIIMADVDPFALTNMYEFNYDNAEGQIVAMVNIGATNTIINILQNGLPVFTRDSAIGSNHHSEALEHGLSIAVSREDIELLKAGRSVDGVNAEHAESLITAASEEIYSEISRSFEYFRSSIGYEEINTIILSGGAALIKGFPEMLGERLGVEVEVADPFKRIKVPEGPTKMLLKDMAPIAAVAFGLALRREGDR